MVLILGVGNEYRRDDALGLIASRRLKDKGLAAVTVAEASGEASALLELWQNAAEVILIDAVQSGAKPGTMHRFEAHRQPIPTRFLRCSTHAFGVAEAIELARALHRLPPCLIVYGVEGANFETGVGLSVAVAKAVDEVIESCTNFLSSRT